MTSDLHVVSRGANTRFTAIRGGGFGSRLVVSTRDQFTTAVSRSCGDFGRIVHLFKLPLKTPLVQYAKATSHLSEIAPFAKGAFRKLEYYF